MSLVVTGDLTRKTMNMKMAVIIMSLLMMSKEEALVSLVFDGYRCYYFTDGAKKLTPPLNLD